jgi:hypothetical protein
LIMLTIFSWIPFSIFSSRFRICGIKYITPNSLSPATKRISRLCKIRIFALITAL